MAQEGTRIRMTSAATRIVSMARRAAARFGIASDGEPVPEVDLTAIIRFIEEVGRIPQPRVIELGTRRQAGQGTTRHSVWVPHAAAYTGVDYEAGEDVDLVADAHELSRHIPCESVDALISCSVFEHIKYPWLAALEIAKVLRIGGFVFIHTHQTFAVHAHPHDYWRFTTDGLKTLFSPALGLEILSCHYQYPCRIVTPDDPGQVFNPSYLNVCLVAKKVGPTPPTFVADLSR